ncbi:hypothetical protein RI367_002272 [Sorochytrium milnesiophthora]
MTKKKKEAAKQASARGFSTTSTPSASKEKRKPDTNATAANDTKTKSTPPPTEQQQPQPAISNSKAKKELQQQIKEQSAVKKTKDSTRDVDPKVKQLLRDLAKDTEVTKIQNTIDDWHRTDVESLPAVQLDSDVEHELFDLLKPIYLEQGAW